MVPWFLFYVMFCLLRFIFLLVTISFFTKCYCILIFAIITIIIMINVTVIIKPPIIFNLIGAMTMFITRMCSVLLMQVFLTSLFQLLTLFTYIWDSHYEGHTIFCTDAVQSHSSLLVFWRNIVHLQHWQVSQASRNQCLLVASLAVSQPSAAVLGPQNHATSYDCSENVMPPW